MYFRRLALLLACIALIQVRMLPAEQVAVVHTEGVAHGFLLLRTLGGNALAVGDLTQTARGDRVTVHLVFRFKDGSINEETTVYSQRGAFRLISDHLVQKGPAFKRPTDLMINGSNGQVTVHYTDDGKEKVVTDRLKLPPDLAHGSLFTLLKNMHPDVPKTTVSMVVATPKPRIVKLVIAPEGEERFSVAGTIGKATRYDVKVEIGGAAGVVAPLVGIQPPDIHVWMLGGEAPAFLKSEGPLFEGGPIWRIELASPTWSQEPEGN